MESVLSIIIQSVAGGALPLLEVSLMLFSKARTANFAIMLGGTFLLSGLLSLAITRLVYTPAEKEVETRKEAIEARDERKIKIREKSAWVFQRVMSVLLCAFVVAVTFFCPISCR